MVNVKVNQKKYMKKLRRFTIIFLEKERTGDVSYIYF